MERRYLQRLVGTLVLLVLAAVFLVFLVQTPQSQAPGQDMTIPEPPPGSTLEVAPVVSNEQQRQAREQIDAERDGLLAATEIAEPESDARDPDGEPEPASEADEQAVETVPAAVTAVDEGMAGYVLQVASFSRADNAQALAGQLRDHGYRAFVEAGESDGRTVYRVNLGPELRRQEIEQTQQQLQADAEFDYSGLIRRFVP